MRMMSCMTQRRPPSSKASRSPTCWRRTRASPSIWIARRSRSCWTRPPIQGCVPTWRARASRVHALRRRSSLHLLPDKESSMLLNALFPTRDIGTDPAKIRDWAQAAEGLGYHSIEVADHVFGAAPRGDWKPVYSETDPFHETFTTMAFIAAVTKTIKLCSAVLILPHRQPAVAANQPAEA